ncbi:hypothetical protein ASPWEDRAFT_121176 [Aspergillus wentii DTO 134E9]|uniref:GCN5-related N-acetyltransferase Rv2170-like domain-containing protein n=1 Tax=Aspergillus wentii DTO 134E9 TaxID=1073089 RepID=A0A1L9R6W4_ASPWE|nr:uncharacterized protein ASPWEDRAFT_121176 [Aspergillus wentii DTO 134E9]OJJ30662.1 hypothetical protein ASPWEDRAFT_121176 [Aspergillus wentii DTO 134E9]
MIYTHPTPQSTLLPILHCHLPNCIPLYRRIQHALVHDNPSHSFSLATFPPSSPPSSSSPWLAAHVNLYRGRETQLFLYSSLEQQSSTVPVLALHDGTYTAELTASDAEKDVGRTQLLALLGYLKTNLLPVYLSFLEEQQQAATNVEEKGVAKIAPPPSTAFLVGSLHTGVLALLTKEESSGLESSVSSLSGNSVSSSISNESITASGNELEHEHEHPLPPGYFYHDRHGKSGIQPKDYSLVASRTKIPRSPESLSKMFGMAIYHRPVATEAVDEPESESESPVAWAFLGYEGALATLHVEPEHRGQGLAIQLVKETLRRGLRDDGVFGEESKYTWAHVDVTLSNAASRRVMEKVGGKMSWTDTWAIVELL